MNLNDGVSAVVTGGASGLGAATARALAGRCVKVAIFDLNVAAGEALAAEIGGVFCEADVTDEASIVAAFDKARAAHGQERVLVNCAGTGSAQKTASRDKSTGATRHHDLDLFCRVVDINLVGSFRCIAKSAQGMLDLPADEDNARGVVINTASAAAEDGQVGQVAYSASKGGVVAMTLPIARDLMNDGIRINTILPGIFDTPLMSRASQSVRESLAASVPFPKRLGVPEEYAHMVIALIENDYINGEDIRLDGAIRMAPR